MSNELTPIPFPLIDRGTDTLDCGSVFTRTQMGGIELLSVAYAVSGDRKVTASLHATSDERHMGARTSVSAMGFPSDSEGYSFVWVSVGSRAVVRDGQASSAELDAYLSVEDAVKLLAHLEYAITEAGGPQ